MLVHWVWERVSCMPISCGVSTSLYDTESLQVAATICGFQTGCGRCMPVCRVVCLPCQLLVQVWGRVAQRRAYMDVNGACQ
jgi:hypothetical protein